MQHLLDLAAAGTGDPTDPLLMLAQYGVLGIVVILLVLYTRGSVNRERERSDKAEQLVKELNEFIRGEMLPKQVESSLLHKQVAEVLEEAIQLITEMKIRDNIRGQGEPPSIRHLGGPHG
jgi:hypothetical protein